MLELALTNNSINIAPIPQSNILAKVYSFILSWPDPRKQDAEEQQDEVSDEDVPSKFNSISKHRVFEE